MNFLIITEQADMVSNYQLDKINKLSAIYACFIKKYIERNNIKVLCLDFNKIKNLIIPEANNCFITINRGVMSLNPSIYENLRRKIKNKIITISETSKFVGQEDILFFINGKSKSKCVKTTLLADPEVFFPTKNNNILTIIVEHKYNKSISSILETDKTDLIIKSLLEFKKVSRKKLFGTFRKKPLQIIYKGKKSFYELNNLEDYEKALELDSDILNENIIGYTDIINFYNKAHIYINTHIKSFGLSILENAMAGTLVVTFEGFIKDQYLSMIKYHVLSKETTSFDWNAIINCINVKESVKMVKKRYTYKNIINKIINVINFNPKVAICFSGAIRNFDRCIPSITKYFLNKFPGSDIFLHLWTFNDSDKENNFMTKFKWRNSSTCSDRIVNILKPVKYVIEEYNDEWEKTILSNSGIDINKFITEHEKNYGVNCCSMYWKILKCFELVEEHSVLNNVKYDLIIRARLDFIWEDYIYPENFKIINNSLNLIKDRYATHSNLITNDKFFAGNQDVMKKMVEIFEKLSKYQDQGLKLDGQVINEAHISQNKFEVNWIGHKDTYYKHMERHNIKLKNINIVIDIENSFIRNELIYNLLENGFTISSVKQVDNYNALFYNYVGWIENPEFIIKSINNLNYEIKKNNKQISLVFEDKLIKTIQNNNIKYFNDFIIDLVENWSDDIFSKYNFSSIKQIVQLNPNEKIIYKYIDRGYFNCEFVTIDIDNNYVIKFNNENITVQRNSFKIKNIIKYYEDGILPIN